MTRQALLIVGFLVAAYPLHSSVAQQQKVGAPPESSNMRLVGWTDLQARRPAPPSPKYLRHLPGQPGKYEAGGAQMVRLCDGASLPKGDRSAVYMLRTFGGEAHEI